MLPTFIRATGKRVWRKDLYSLGGWKPDANETEQGVRTEFRDGIYIVTVHEGTPTDWLALAASASVAAHEQHPGPNFMPADNYDSAIAVVGRRIVGGALVKIESAARYRWKIQLRPDGEAYTDDELFGEEGQEYGVMFDKTPGRPPAIYTIWVHPAHRGQEIGGQLVRAIAEYCGLPLEKLCFRFPLSKQAVRMTQRLGLDTIIGCS